MRTKLASRIGAASLLAMPMVSACSSSDPGTDDSSQQTADSTRTTSVGGRSESTSKSVGGNALGSTSTVGGTTSSGSVAVLGGSNSVGGSMVGGASTARQRSGGGVGGSGSNAGGANTGGQAAEVGGSATAGGTKSTGTRSAGGATASGGNSMGTVAAGGSSKGGSASGGSSSKGGNASGGSSKGGGASGGSSKGGSASGGSASGGSSSGSTALGGSATGGTSVAGAEDDGCSDTLALGLTISEIAVFQTGKISIMKAGTEVAATTQYGAEVIEGRETMFRVYVTADSGFQSRQLSARLTLNDGATHYYAKQTISASSTELSSANSFLISVPASAIGAGLNYSVQIVECATGSGTAHTPTFPTSGSASIATRATGVIKVTLVPATANGITPTLDSLSVDLKQHIEAVYPTTSAEITVATSPITGCGITPTTATDGTTWSKCLTLVRNRRTSDRPANDMYYMGIVTPASSYSGYCGNACIAGISYVSTSATAGSSRAAMAVGYDPAGLTSIVHELGHSHGLEHSPGCGADQADSAFPYVKNGTAYIGWVGWDRRSPTTVLDPAKYKDMMGYCDPPWVSDYVYAKFADRIAALNGAALLRGASAVSTWRVLDVIGGEASWGTPIVDPAPPEGEPESGTVYDSSGRTLLEITVYRTEIRGAQGFMYLVPEPSADWFMLRVGSTLVEF